jgi:hypothetical protein
VLVSVESRASWVIAVTAVVILSISFGAPLLVVVALAPIAADLGDARSSPALASSLAYLGAGAGGILMGWIAGRTSTRLITMVGGAMVCRGWRSLRAGRPGSWWSASGCWSGCLATARSSADDDLCVALVRPGGGRRWRWSLRAYVAGALWPALLERLIAAHGCSG